MHDYVFEDSAGTRSYELLSKLCDLTAKHPCSSVELFADTEDNDSQPHSESASFSTASITGLYRMSNIGCYTLS